MYRYEEADQVWIRKAKRGDTKAFAHLYGKIYQDLYRFALYMLKHPQDAEDAVSESVIAAYENISKLRKDEAFGSWMFQILNNCCKKKLAAQQKVINWSESGLGDDADSQIPSAEEDLAKQQSVREAFESLNEVERRIIGLSVFGGYKSTEIGEVLDMKPATIRSKRSRAFAKLKKSLGKECSYES